MAVFHFGTDVDGSLFIEQPGNAPASPTATTAPARPARGVVISVRNAATGANLPPITVGDFGYWSYSTDDIPIIKLSLDNWQTSLTVISAEAQESAATASLDIAATKALAAAANTTANDALALVQQTSSPIESVNGKIGTVILSASDVGARPIGTNVPAAQVSGLAPVATTGAYADLTSKPPTAVSLATVGQPGGVAALDATGKVPAGQLPATTGTGGGGTVQWALKVGGVWPARPTADPKVMVIWKGPYPEPNIVASGTGGMLDGVDVQFVTP